MKIKGLQKTTLLDFPGKLACTVFTGGCNFRCPFCHNASLVLHAGEMEEISEEAFFDYLNKRRGMLDGVCITGGEPTLCPDLENFIKKIKDIGLAVKLDTNGTAPTVLKRLLDSNLLDYVAMDIKNSKEKYALTSGIENLDINNIEESVNFLLSDSVDYEFRTTVVDVFHNTQDIEKIAMWIGGAKRYFLQNFVDSGDLIGDKMGSVGEETLNKMCFVAQKYVENTIIRGV